MKPPNAWQKDWNGKYRLCFQTFSSGHTRVILSRSITQSQDGSPPSINLSPLAGKPRLASQPHPWHLPRNNTKLLGKYVGGQKPKAVSGHCHSPEWDSSKQLPGSHWTSIIPRGPDGMKGTVNLHHPLNPNCASAANFIHLCFVYFFPVNIQDKTGCYSECAYPMLCKHQAVLFLQHG